MREDWWVWLSGLVSTHEPRGRCYCSSAYNLLLFLSNISESPLTSHHMLLINIIYRLQQKADIDIFKNSKRTSDTLVFLLLHHDFYVASCFQVSGDTGVNLCELMYVFIVLKRKKPSNTKCYELYSVHQHVKCVFDLRNHCFDPITFFYLPLSN